MNKKLKISLLIIILLLLLEIYLLSYYKSFTAIYFLNVGQGDSTLIKTKDGKYILIDTGKDYMAFEESSKYFIKGNNRIELLIITHFDKDHIGALNHYIKNYSINAYALNINDPDYSKSFEAIFTGEKVLTPLVNDIFKIGCCLTINWLNPTLHEKSLESNDYSLVFVININKYKLYFGGDISSSIEDKISNHIGKIDFLKVSHHGSSSSTSEYFLKNTNPSYAFISSGINNQYNHPSERVINSLVNFGAIIYRTDLNGTVILLIFDYNYYITTNNSCMFFCDYYYISKHIFNN